MPDRPTRPDAPKKSVAPLEVSNPVPAIAAGRRRLLVGGVAAGPILLAASTRSALAATCQSPSQVFSGNQSSATEQRDCDAGWTPEFWKQNFALWPPVVGEPPIDLEPPRIELRKLEPPRQNTWPDDGTGEEPLDWFFPTGQNNTVLPKARIEGTDCTTTGGISGGARFFYFGTAFGYIFGFNTGGLQPVVPTMDGNGENCNGSATDIADRPVSLWEVLAFWSEQYPKGVASELWKGELASVVAAAYLNSVTFEDYPVKPGQIIHMWNDGVTQRGYCPISGCTKPWDAGDIMTYLRSTFDRKQP